MVNPCQCVFRRRRRMRPTTTIPLQYFTPSIDIYSFTILAWVYMPKLEKLDSHFSYGEGVDASTCLYNKAKIDFFTGHNYNVRRPYLVTWPTGLLSQDRKSAILWTFNTDVKWVYIAVTYDSSTGSFCLNNNTYS